MDLISQLPKEIIESILFMSSLSSRDVVRLSILSKTWYRLCNSFPISDFEAPEDPILRDKFFNNFVFPRLLKQTHVPRFRLTVEPVPLDFKLKFLGFEIPDVDRSLYLANSKGLEELDLEFRRMFTPFPLPLINFTESLRVLRLTVVTLPLINLPSSLRVLSLTRCEFGNQRFQSLILNIPLIEEITVDRVPIHLTEIQLLGLHNLRKLIIRRSMDCSEYTDVHISNCENLQVLELQGTSSANQTLNFVIPQLQELILRECEFTGEGPIRICSHYLEKLKLVGNKIISGCVTIEAPLLPTFKFSCDEIPTVFSMINCSSLSKVMLNIFRCKTSNSQNVEYAVVYYDVEKVRAFLENFSRVGLVTFGLPTRGGVYLLDCLEKENTVIPPLPNARHMELKMGRLFRKTMLICLVDGLLQSYKPESLTFKSGSGSNNLAMQILYEKLWMKGIDYEIHGLPGILAAAGRVCQDGNVFMSLPPNHKIIFVLKW